MRVVTGVESRIACGRPQLQPLMHVSWRGSPHDCAGHIEISLLCPEKPAGGQVPAVVSHSLKSLHCVRYARCVWRAAPGNLSSSVSLKTTVINTFNT